MLCFYLFQRPDKANVQLRFLKFQQKIFSLIMSEEMDKNIYFDYDDTHIREDAKKRYILSTSRTEMRTII